jgi:hypothetical protein
VITPFERAVVTDSEEANGGETSGQSLRIETVSAGEYARERDLSIQGTTANRACECCRTDRLDHMV